MEIRDDVPTHHADVGDPRGVLYPSRLPTFDRIGAPEDLAELIRWFWVPRWDLAPGETSKQTLLPFPAANLVVDPDGVTLAGPTTGVSHRELSGRGWAVGALLRPAGLGRLHPDPATVKDREVELDLPDLHRCVADAVGPNAHADAGVPDRAAMAFSEWAVAHLSSADHKGQLANAMEELIAEDREIVRVEQLADLLGVSVRGVQRLARRYVGLPPLSIIRRYRLQEAAQRLRSDPLLTIAQVAAELGYADHAHLGSDFRNVLGLTARDYRRGAANER